MYSLLQRVVADAVVPIHLAHAQDKSSLARAASSSDLCGHPVGRDSRAGLQKAGVFLSRDTICSSSAADVIDSPPQGMMKSPKAANGTHTKAKAQ